MQVAGAGIDLALRVNGCRRRLHLDSGVTFSDRTTPGNERISPAHRHWPDGYDPGHADLFAHNTIVIDAPAGTIWARLIAAAWPTWYSNASDVVVNDPSGTL
jgi:hypothetical protein